MPFDSGSLRSRHSALGFAATRSSLRSKAGSKPFCKDEDIVSGENTSLAPKLQLGAAVQITHCPPRDHQDSPKTIKQRPPGDHHQSVRTLLGHQNATPKCWRMQEHAKNHSLLQYHDESGLWG